MEWKGGVEGWGPGALMGFGTGTRDEGKGPTLKGKARHVIDAESGDHWTSCFPWKVKLETAVTVTSSHSKHPSSNQIRMLFGFSCLRHFHCYDSPESV